MAASEVASTSALRRIMNEIVGSRAAKARAAQDGRVAQVAALLVAPGLEGDVRILAANILGSVAQHASPATLLALLRADVPFLLLTRLGAVAADVRRDSGLGAREHHRALESIVRALRAVMCSVSDQIGYSTRWGIGTGWGFASMAGLEHIDSRNSELASNRPTAHSLRQDISWHAAGPSAVAVRTTIAEAWMPMVEHAAWVDRHTDRDDARSSKAARTEDEPKLRPSAERANSNEYQAMCASIDEGAALDEHDAFAALNWLCRSAVSMVFDMKSLHLLLGAMLLAYNALPQESGANAPGAAAIRSRSHVLQGRNQAFGMIETVSELLAACMAIPGIEHYHTSVAATRLRLTRASAPLQQLYTPQDELERRTAAFAHFAPWDSPFAVQDGAASSEGVSSTAVRILLGAVGSNAPKVQEAVLWVLHELLASSQPEGLQRLVSVHAPSGTSLPSVVAGLAQSRARTVRLAAYCCLAQLLRSESAPMAPTALVQGMVGLLDASGAVQVQACFALSRLVCDRPELQAAAVERFQACEKLGAILQHTSTIVNAQAPERGAMAMDELTVRLHEGCLTALSSLAVLSDTVRRRVVDCTPSFLSSILLPSLSSRAVGVQVAACRMVRILSRTIGILRTSLFDAGFADRLLELLKQDENEVIHTEIIATICNMLVKFSPMKQFLVEHGGLEALTRFARSPHGPVRLNALWAVKNAVWDSDLAFKERVMELFGWDYLAELTHSSDGCIQEQALNIVRNLTSSPQADMGRHEIDMTLERFGKERLLDAIEEAVWSLRNDGATEQAAFILANIASGSERHRALVIDRPNLIDALCYFLRHASHAIREAGVRCGFNLSYHITDSASEASADAVWHRAVDRLRAFGYDKLLKELEYDPDLNVRDRVRDTLAQI